MWIMSYKPPSAAYFLANQNVTLHQVLSRVVAELNDLI